MNDCTIERFELFAVAPRWLFLKISTRDGNFGWGEPIVEGRAETVRAAVEEVSDALIGRDARRIEDLWQIMYRGAFYRGGPVLTSAMSGIEQALWDLRGRELGMPIHELMGGAVRDKMRVYAWIGGDAFDLDATAAGARARVAEGFTALKLNATAQTEWIDSAAKIERTSAMIARIRQEVGPEIGIGIDFHGRVHRGTAKVLAAELEQYRPLFYEEPVLPENVEALAEVGRHTSVPIAAGERLYTRWGFKQVLAEGLVDIIQPDISHTGGIWETRKIAAMAEAYDIAVAPHCPLGPIALAASLQLDFCTPNAFIQEQSLGIHYNETSDLLDYLVDPGVFKYDAGYVPLMTGPGLGITIDEDKVRESAEKGDRWRNQLWRNEDGSLAEW